MIELSMWDYLEKPLPVQLSRTRAKQRDEKATAEEVSAYRGLAGTLMYMGNSVIPQAAMVTSKMQQNLGDLRVRHILEGNSAVKEIINLGPYIRYLRPSRDMVTWIISLSDAAHGGADTIYG